MTYRIRYVVVKPRESRMSYKYERGAFVLDAADAAGAHAGADRVLRDACDFAVRAGIFANGAFASAADVGPFFVSLRDGQIDAVGVVRIGRGTYEVEA